MVLRESRDGQAAEWREAATRAGLRLAEWVRLACDEKAGEGRAMSDDDLTDDEIEAVNAEVGRFPPRPENWNGPFDSPYEATLAKVLARVVRERDDLRAATRALLRDLEPADLPGRGAALLAVRVLLQGDG